MHKKTFFKILIIVAVLLVGGTALFFINPEKTVWAPKCPFLFLTGYQCPGCGSQRAVHSLLHFQFGKAWSYNAFLILSLPYVLVLLITWALPENHLVKVRAIANHYITIIVYLSLLILWWIGRNIF